MIVHLLCVSMEGNVLTKSMTLNVTVVQAGVAGTVRSVSFISLLIHTQVPCIVLIILKVMS